MSKNVLKDQTKPILVRNEKNRYPNAAQYFIEGGNKFYENCTQEVKQMVDIQALRGKAMQVLTERVEEVKKEIQDKIENIKRGFKIGISDFFLKMITILEQSIIGLYFFGDKLKSIYDKHKKFILKFLNKLKLAAQDGIQEIKDLFDFSMDFGSVAVQQLFEIVVKVSEGLGSFAWYVIDKLWDFFNAENGNVFVDLLNQTGRVAGSRARGVIGIIMRSLSDIVTYEVERRPTLKNYFRFGSNLVYSISDVERYFEQMDRHAHNILGDVRNVTLSTLQGDYNLKTVNKVSDEEEMSQYFKEISDSIYKSFYDGVQTYDVNNILSEIDVTKAFPIDSLKKRYTHNGANGILNKKFKVENHHTYYNFELKNMSFIEKLDNLSVYEDKIKNFLKRYEKSDNEVVNKIRKEWYEYSKDGQNDAYKYVMIRPLLYSVLIFESAQHIIETSITDYSRYDALYNKIQQSQAKNEVRMLIDDYFNDVVGIDYVLSNLSNFLAADKMFEELKSYGLIKKYINLEDTFIVLRERTDVMQKMRFMKDGIDSGNLYFIGNDGVLSQYSSLPQIFKIREQVDESDKLATTHIGEKQGNDVVQAVQLMVDGHNKVIIGIKKRRKRRVLLLQAIIRELEKLPKKNKNK